MIDGKNVFYQTINNDFTTYENFSLLLKEILHNWLFVRLSLFQRKLKIDCNRFKQTAGIKY